MRAQIYSVSKETERRKKTFLEWTSRDLCGGNVNYYKSVHHLIPNLTVRIGNTMTFSKQISKLSF